VTPLLDNLRDSPDRDAAREGESVIDVACGTAAPRIS
jgi:hypothetical protein